MAHITDAGSSLTQEEIERLRDDAGFEGRDRRWAEWATANGYDAEVRDFYFNNFPDVFDHGFTARRTSDGLLCLVGDPYEHVRPDHPAIAQLCANGFDVTVVRPGFWFPYYTTAFIFACRDPWLGFCYLTREYVKNYPSAGRWCETRSLGPVLGVKGPVLAEFRKRYWREKAARLGIPLWLAKGAP